MGDLVSKEGGRRQWLAFVRSVGSAGGVSFIPLPTLSGNPPSDAEHRDASSSPNHPSSLPEPPLHVSLCSCQLVKLPPPPLLPRVPRSIQYQPSATRIELPPSQPSLHPDVFFLFLRLHVPRVLSQPSSFPFFFSFVLNGFEGWYFLGEGYLFIHILEYLFAYLSILMQLILLSSQSSLFHLGCNFIYIREKEKIAAS